MRDRNVCVRLTSGIVSLFKPLSPEEEWAKLRNELKQHMGSIYDAIGSFSDNPYIYDALITAYSKNDGLDCLDALRKEINHLHKQYRSSIGSCERCGELTYQCCLMLCCISAMVCLTVMLGGKSPQPFPPIHNAFNNMEYSYEDPRHYKSPYSSLAKAVSNYSDWYSKIPKQYTNELLDASSFQMTCESIKHNYNYGVKNYGVKCHHTLKPVD